MGEGYKVDGGADAPWHNKGETLLWAFGSLLEALLLIQAGCFCNHLVPNSNYSSAPPSQLMVRGSVLPLVVRSVALGATSLLGYGMLVWEAFKQTWVGILGILTVSSLIR